MHVVFCFAKSSLPEMRGKLQVDGWSDYDLGQVHLEGAYVKPITSWRDFLGAV